MLREIAVINLMRFGDLIQSSPVFRGLRKRHPEACLTLVAQDLFQEIAALIPEVDRLVLFPGILLSTWAEEEGGWAKGLVYLEAWLKESFPQPPELVINLTPTVMGALLAYLLKGRECRGILVNERRSLLTLPFWASYTLVVSRARQANPFNLVDLFQKEAGLAPDGLGLAVRIPEAAEEEAESFFRQLQLSPSVSRVGLMPGASRPERCWPAANFARGAGLLLEKRDCHFFIFGSRKEAPLGEAIARELPAEKVSVLTGQTPAPLLAALLKRLQLLITNDTGPMHLAAAVRTPVLALFLATARVHDTGPVGRGHLVLEPRLSCHPCLTPCPLWRCHQGISPEAVSWLAHRRLSGGPEEWPAKEPLWPELRLFWADYDPEGHQVYVPLGRRPLERRDFWLWVHRLLWGRVLDPPAAGSLLKAWLSGLLRTCYLPPEEALEVEAGKSCLRELSQAAGEGERQAVSILTAPETMIRYPGRLWQQIQALKRMEESLLRLAAAFPEIRSLVEFYFQVQRHHEGEEILSLCTALRESCRLLRRLAQAGIEGLSFLEKHLARAPQEADLRELAQPLQRLQVSS